MELIASAMAFAAAFMFFLLCYDLAQRIGNNKR